MGKIIRRTVTITTTETWTIVWLPEDEPQHQAPRLVQEQPKTQEEQHAALQTTLIATELTLTAVTDPQPDDVSTQPAAKGRCIRRRRKAAHTQPSE